MVSIDIEARLLEIVGYVERIPHVTKKLDATLESARRLDETIRDLTAALTVRDDIQSRSISILDVDFAQLQATVSALSGTVDVVMSDLLTITDALREQIKIMQNLLEN